jgi:hypothetical protein
LPEYRTLLGGLARAMTDNPLVVETNAGPQVEIVVRDQPWGAVRRRMVSFINYSGQNGRSFHDPVELREIYARVAWDLPVSQVRATVLDADLPFEQADGVVTFRLPTLNLFEKVILD